MRQSTDNLTLTPQQERLLLVQSCREASEELFRDIAEGYPRGSRRADRRHTVATLAVCLGLAVATANIVGWMYPYQMSDGNRSERLAAYTLTQHILQQA